MDRILRDSEADIKITEIAPSLSSKFVYTFLGFLVRYLHSDQRLVPFFIPTCMDERTQTGAGEGDEAAPRNVCGPRITAITYTTSAVLHSSSSARYAARRSHPFLTVRILYRDGKKECTFC